MAAKAWKLLEKKVNTFNEKFPGASVICMGVISNIFVTAGSDDMKRQFLSKPEIGNFYKEAVLAQTFVDTDQRPQDPHQLQPQDHPQDDQATATVNILLHQHVYDMDVGILRSLISSAVAPLYCLSNKDSRRNLYVVDNVPAWWLSTGIPFQSVNHGLGGGKKLVKPQLMQLVEALQRTGHIVPNPPQKKNSTNYMSCFLYEPDQEGPTGEHEATPEKTTECTTEGMTNRTTEGTKEATPDGTKEVTPEGTTEGTTDGTTNRTTEGKGANPNRQSSIQDKRETIGKIFMEEITLDEKCLKVMRLIKTWDEVWGLAAVISDHLPPFDDTLSNEWRARTLVDTNKKYEDFIPMSIGDRTVYQSTANGNCIYNAVSIALYGSEDRAMVLKLASIIKMVDDIVPFSKYIVAEFKELLALWVTSNLVQVTEASTAEEVEYACRQELVATLEKGP